MIYTVTFNPSLDYIVTVDNFRLSMTNRTSTELMLPGGKGVNVSILLRNLGVENTALGFVAGFTGTQIENMVCAMGVKSDFISVENGLSRINLKLKNIDGTEINGMGPAISEAKQEELFGKLEQLQKGDVLVLAGSIPASMADDTYQRILERLKGKDVLVIVDATSSLLTNILQYHPFLIKPNNHELGDIFGVELQSDAQIAHYAKELMKQGARNVLVSMGGKGAMLVAENGDVYRAEAPKGELRNSVGAGDSMVAGFLTGWLKSSDYKEAFRMGVGAGSASAFSEYLATGEEVQKVAEQVVITQM